MPATTRKPKLTVNILNKESTRIELEIGGVPIHVLNALKRIVQSEVKTLAADLLYLQKNTTVIQDEVLAHRLGLIPIEVPEKVLKEESKDIKISIDILCEKGTPKDPQLVFSEDLVLTAPAKIACPGILIAKLIKGQQLKFEAICRTGIAKDHSKWSPVCDVTFMKIPKKETWKFCIETVGSRDPVAIFTEAISVLRQKCIWASNSQ